MKKLIYITGTIIFCLAIGYLFGLKLSGKYYLNEFQKNTNEMLVQRSISHMNDFINLKDHFSKSNVDMCRIDALISSEKKDIDLCFQDAHCKAYAQGIHEKTNWLKNYNFINENSLNIKKCL